MSETFTGDMPVFKSHVPCPCCFNHVFFILNFSPFAGSPWLAFSLSVWSQSRKIWGSTKGLSEIYPFRNSVIFARQQKHKSRVSALIIAMSRALQRLPLCDEMDNWEEQWLVLKLVVESKSKSAWWWWEKQWSAFPNRHRGDGHPLTQREFHYIKTLYMEIYTRFPYITYNPMYKSCL
jgi:hypothetical protein